MRRRMQQEEGKWHERNKKTSGASGVEKCYSRKNVLQEDDVRRSGRNLLPPHY